MAEIGSTPPAHATLSAPTLLQILLSFSLISLYGFGGVLAWTRRMMIEERRWMTPEEFRAAFARDYDEVEKQISQIKVKIY